MMDKTNKGKRWQAKINKGIRQHYFAVHEEWNIFRDSEMRERYTKGWKVARLSCHYGLSEFHIKKNIIDNFFKK